MLWIERTPPDFTFNIKAYSLLTNHPTKRESLYKDLQDCRGAGRQAERLPGAAPRRAGRRGLAALPRRADAAALGGQAGGGAVPVPAVVRDLEEVARPTSTSAPSACPTTGWRWSSGTSAGWRSATSRRRSSFLEERDLPFVCVDMPQGFDSSHPSDRRRDREGPRDGPLPRPRPRGVGAQGHPPRSGSATTTSSDELEEWVPEGRGARRRRRARPTC